MVRNDLKDRIIFPVYSRSSVEMIREKKYKWMILLDHHKSCNSMFQALHKKEFTKTIRDAMMDDIMVFHAAGDEALKDQILKTVLNHCLGVELSQLDYQTYKNKYDESLKWHHQSSDFKAHIHRLLNSTS